MLKRLIIGVFGLWLTTLSVPSRAADEAVEIIPDVVYGHKYGMALTMDVLKPREGANGAGVLFMVSGGWFSAWAPPENTVSWNSDLLDKGFTVFMVRHGSSPKFVIPEVIEDVRRSVRFIRANAERFGVDPERLGVTGGSAGGHLSLILGTTADPGNPTAPDPIDRVSDRVAAVVAFYPPTDLRPWVGTDSEYNKNFPALQFDPDKAKDCSPLLQVTSDDPPTLLIHGDKDELVPLTHSEQIHRVFEENKVVSRLMIIEGAAHGFSGDDARRASRAKVEWFMKTLLKHEPPAPPPTEKRAGQRPPR